MNHLSHILCSKLSPWSFGVSSFIKATQKEKHKNLRPKDEKIHVVVSRVMTNLTVFGLITVSRKEIINELLASCFGFLRKTNSRSSPLSQSSLTLKQDEVSQYFNIVD